MSLTFKLLSLAIRTVAKPIGNYIKRQAKEHEGFRRFAVAQAQRVHWIDMRMRLGILHDPAAQERMHEREQKAAEEKKRKEETPMVRTEAEQKKYDEAKAKEEKEQQEGKKKEEKSPRVRIRPLSDARAIELGANFFSEAFIFGVAAGLLIWDTWRSRRKESARRDVVAERLQQLEEEVKTLQSQLHPDEQVMLALEHSSQSAEKEKPKWWNPLAYLSNVTEVVDAAATDAAADHNGKTAAPVEVRGADEQESAASSDPNARRDEKKAQTKDSAVERVDKVQASSAGR